MTNASTEVDPSPDVVGARWEQLKAGTSLGRYEVVRRLGAGAMGVVYLGLDHELDREVAIKMSFERSDRDLRRFAREARAMAAIVHPNVVEVFDYGVRDGQPYLVMAVLPGGTLREACEEAPLERRVERLLEAGRGLRAAHRLGIVHRDFKPSNVLLDARGHAVVTDFGLAVATTALQPGVTSELEQTAGAGTPAYMSPEQHKGEDTDARSDQYSFCVTVAEMLTGSRPFRAGTGRTLVEAKQQGVDPARLRALPRAIRVALRTGLHPNPVHRFQSMGPILEALSGRMPVVSTKPNRAVWTIPVSMVGVAAATLALGERQPDRCNPTNAPAWSEQDATRWTTIFPSSGSRLREQTRAQLEQMLTGYADDWTTQYERTCSQDGTPRRRAQACLDQGARAFGALRNDLLRGDFRSGTVVQQAAELPDPRACTPDVDTPSPADAVWLAEVERVAGSAVEQIRRNRAGSDLSMPELAPPPATVSPFAYESVERVRPLIDRISSPAIRAQARLRLAHVFLASDDQPHASALLHAALDDIAGEPPSELEADLCLRMAWVDGTMAGDPSAGLRWVRRSQSLMERVHVSPEIHGRAYSMLAAQLSAQGNNAEARLALETGVAMLEGLQPLDRPSTKQLAKLVYNLGSVRGMDGDLREALIAFERSLTLDAQILGPLHPNLVDTLQVMVRPAVQLGDYPLAIRITHQWLEILEDLHGKDSPSLASAYGVLSMIASKQGDVNRSIEHQQQRARLLDVGNPDRLMADLSIAADLRDVGRTEQADELLAITLLRIENVDGPEFLRAKVAGLHARARRALREGRLDRAVELILTCRAKAEGTPHEHNGGMSYARTEAKIRIARGESTQALAILEPYEERARREPGSAGSGEVLEMLARLREAD